MSQPTTENLKTAYQEARKDLESDKQALLKAKIQAIIKATLEKIEDYEESIESQRQGIKADQRAVATLRADLKDLEAGRLDLIEERQKNDANAKDVSIAVINKILSDERCEQTQPWKNVFTLMSNTIGSITTTGTSFTNYVPGTYALDSGNVVNIRPFYY